MPKFSFRKKLLRNERLFFPAFSLVEVIVVMAIISIISVFIALSFSSIASKKLETQTRQLVNDLCWVRDMSFARHRNFVVELVPSTKQYSIYKDSVAPANLLERKNLDIDSLRIIPASSTTLQFNYPNGVTAQKVQFVLTQNARSSNIIVFDETGYVYWQ